MAVTKEEVWKPAVGFEGKYEVSNFGDVRSIGFYARICGNGQRYVRPKLLRKWIDKKGYYNVSITNSDNIRYNKKVHRLVADAFIPNDDVSRVEIDHIDTNRLNNNVSNLRWVTHKENMNNIKSVIKQYLISSDSKMIERTLQTKRLKNTKTAPKKCYQYDLDGNLIATFESICEASRITGINSRNINSVCLGTRKTAGGYKWSN